MQYKDTLAYLYAQLPMYQREGKSALKAGLDNIHALLALLGRPHDNFKSVHIAGTNGKGSTSHMIAAGLQAAGYRVGLYTSPHYRDFRERIKVNGRLISKRAVTRFVQNHKDEYASLNPSFFELSVAMAFDYFSEQEVDIAVVETGLGGRLDSTNVLQPVLSVITNIAYDHMDVLGHNLGDIAFEKAGIIKQQTPVIIGETQSETQPVFRHIAGERKAPLFFVDEEYDYQILNAELSSQEIRFTHLQDGPDLEATLANGAEYQVRNARTALMALRMLGQAGFSITDAQICAGFAEFDRLTRYVGRWQVLQQDPLIICDSAHNMQGITRVVRELEALGEGRKLHLVLGFVQGKRYEELLSLFPEEADYYICSPSIPRAVPVKEVFAFVQSKGLQARAYISVRRALAAAKRMSGGKDVVFVGGSSFVVAEVV